MYDVKFALETLQRVGELQLKDVKTAASVKIATEIHFSSALNSMYYPVSRKPRNVFGNEKPSLKVRS